MTQGSLYLILEGGEIHDRTQLYDTLKTLLGNPEVFGRNLDGLHDVLTDLLAGNSLTFEVRGFDTLEKELGRYARAFRGMLTDLSEDDRRFTVRFSE